MVDTAYRLSLSAELSIVALASPLVQVLVGLVLLCASPPSPMLDPAMSVDYWAVGFGILPAISPAASEKRLLDRHAKRRIRFLALWWVCSLALGTSGVGLC